MDKILSVTKDVIFERLSRKPRRKRHSVAESKLLEWVECMDPELSLDDLPDYNKERIDDYKELKRLIEKRDLDRARLAKNEEVTLDGI